MYRQILVDEEQCNLQQILWRSSPDEEIQAYSLKTVTYGTASAPYLATRVLNQLAEDEKLNYPVAADVAQRDFYVDDVLSGAESVQEAKELQQQLIELLKAGGFELHKWSTNSPQLLNHYDTPQPVQLSESHAVKTLGLSWHPAEDLFVISTEQVAITNLPSTKRTVFSVIARLYDPLGLAGPVIVTGKMMLQRLWRQQLKWDQPLAQANHNQWLKFRQELNNQHLLRVGGLLCNSKQPFETKQEIVSPKNHHFTLILIRGLYQINGPAGQQTLLGIVKVCLLVIPAEEPLSESTAAN
jgi:hypothetical protein